MPLLYIGADRPDLLLQVVDEDDEPENLVGATATVKIRKIPGSPNKIERPAIAVDLSIGRFDFNPQADDFSPGDEGVYKLWLEIILADLDVVFTDETRLQVKNHEE